MLQALAKLFFLLPIISFSIHQSCTGMRMAHAFRAVASLGRHSSNAMGSRFSTVTRIRPESTFGRRQYAASIALIAVVSSATALSSQNNDNTPHFHNSHNSLLNATTTYCEGEVAEVSVWSETASGSTTAEFPESLLKYDHYNGIIVHLDWLLQHPNKTTDETPDQAMKNQQLFQKWSQDPKAFGELLEKSLLKWKAEGRKGIWIHLPSSLSSVVPACIKLGFDFHSCQTHNRINANGDTGSTNLILSQWLPTDVKSRLPLGPYFQAGVGCVVLHPDDPSKMLVVQEITGPAAARKLWKMPTGLIDPGEDISEAALRELGEETGLTGAKCEGVLAFRQAHGASAGRATSDFFFVCLLSLSPSSRHTVDNLKPQEHEILDIRWMPVKEYCGQEIWQKSPVYLELNQAIIEAVENQKQGKKTPMVAAHQLSVGFMPGSNTVYRSNL